MPYEIASPLTQAVLKLRQERGEFQVDLRDSSHRRLYRVSGYRPFVADVDERDDTDASGAYARDSGLDLIPVRFQKER